jgi:hypothetical protein
MHILRVLDWARASGSITCAQKTSDSNQVCAKEAYQRQRVARILTSKALGDA